MDYFSIALVPVFLVAVVLAIVHSERGQRRNRKMSEEARSHSESYSQKALHNQDRIIALLEEQVRVLTELRERMSPGTRP